MTKQKCDHEVVEYTVTRRVDRLAIRSDGTSEDIQIVSQKEPKTGICASCHRRVRLDTLGISQL